MLVLPLSYSDRFSGFKNNFRFSAHFCKASTFSAREYTKKATMLAKSVLHYLWKCLIPLYSLTGYRESRTSWAQRLAGAACSHVPSGATSLIAQTSIRDKLSISSKWLGIGKEIFHSFLQCGSVLSGINVTQKVKVIRQDWLNPVWTSKLGRHLLTSVRSIWASLPIWKLFPNVLLAFQYVYGPGTFQPSELHNLWTRNSMEKTYTWQTFEG